MRAHRSNRSRPGGRGFTLIEMIITVTIIGILFTAAFPVAELVVRRTKESELKSALRDIRTAVDAYKRATDEGRVAKKADESGYPPSLEILVEGAIDARSPQRTKIYFLRRLPRDPFADEPSAPPAATWGKRSYASAHDDPREGADVFDVYSRATGVGLAGIAYREW